MKKPGSLGSGPGFGRRVKKRELALRLLPYARRMPGPPHTRETHANSATHLGLEAHHSDLVQSFEEQKEAPRPESAEGNVRRFSSLFRCPFDTRREQVALNPPPMVYTTRGGRGCQAHHSGIGCLLIAMAGVILPAFAPAFNSPASLHLFYGQQRLIRRVHRRRPPGGR
jgi:hypothetical protein